MGDSAVKNICVFFLLTSRLAAQYAPAAGQPGSTAIYRDSAVFVGWASFCVASRGFQDISNPQAGYASSGQDMNASGKADGVTVSLGDGGTATCSFSFPVQNGPGADFAVFENAITHTFLELAFVEVSSDGQNFFRFKAHSLTDTTTQTGPFAGTDPTKLNNLAGKYRDGYGVPFDLQELAGQNGLDLNNVTHLRIIDVIGSMQSQYAKRDGYNNKVNDPWPTPFPQSGFDLDAIGVIYQNNPLNIQDHFTDKMFRIRNPIPIGLELQLPADIRSAELFGVNGQRVSATYDNSIKTEGLTPGFYFLRIYTDSQVLTQKLLLFL
jgi:hypothetical protein